MPGCSSHSPLRGRSAELSRYDSADPSTDSLRIRVRFRLGEDPNQRFSTGRADEYAAVSIQLRVQPPDLFEHGLGKLAPRHADVRLRLWVARHRGCRFLERSPLERRAEEEPGDQA